MKEKPILFSIPMVRAILDGSKTQTRRVIKPQPPTWCVYAGLSEMTPPGQWEFRGPYNDRSAAKFIPCPYLPASETTLWVRENGWERPYRSDRMLAEGADTWPPYIYDADCTEFGEFEQLKEWGWKRRPSIHMPRWACRITMAIKSIRVQPLRDISEEDAIAEGVNAVSVADVPRNAAWSARQDFAQLWDGINGKRPGCSWAANPWVWVLTFVRNRQEATT